MQIRILEPREFPRYEALAAELGTIFDTLPWLDLFGENLNIHGIFDDGARLIGAFYVHCRRRGIVTVQETPPYTPSIGLFFFNPARNRANRASFTKDLIRSVAEFLDNLPGQVVMVSLPRSLVDVQPFLWRRFSVVPYFTYIIDLSESEGDILAGMSAERRNDLKRAEKDGIMSQALGDYRIVRDLVVRTFSRQSMAPNEMMLDKILFRFANETNSFAFAAYREGVPIAASFCLHDRNTAYYLLGGYDGNNRHHGAGALTVWDAIRHSKRLGLARFDFEGSMVPAIERYFRDFGGSLVPYYRINKAWLPLEILLKFFRRELF